MFVAISRIETMEKPHSAVSEEHQRFFAASSGLPSRVHPRPVVVDESKACLRPNIPAKKLKEEKSSKLEPHTNQSPSLSPRTYFSNPAVGPSLNRMTTSCLSIACPCFSLKRLSPLFPTTAQEPHLSSMSLAGKFATDFSC